MASIGSKLNTLVWYLKRPSLYPEMLRTIKSRLFGVSIPAEIHGSREEATRWCRECAVSNAEAIAELGVGPMGEPIRDRFRDVFVAAEAAARNCPAPMGGPGDLDLLYAVSEFLQAERVVETGVAYGWSSLALLLSLSKRSNALLISTNMPYPTLGGDEFVGCVVPRRYRDRWEILRRADREALPKALARLGTLDMCHYDSDKSFEGRMWAYPLLWKALRPGGIFISDDIDCNLGFAHFCEQIGLNPIVVRVQESGQFQKYAGVLVKSGASERSRPGEVGALGSARR